MFSWNFSQPCFLIWRLEVKAANILFVKRQMSHSKNQVESHSVKLNLKKPLQISYINESFYWLTVFSQGISCTAVRFRSQPTTRLGKLSVFFLCCGHIVDQGKFLEKPPPKQHIFYLLMERHWAGWRSLAVRFGESFLETLFWFCNGVFAGVSFYSRYPHRRMSPGISPNGAIPKWCQASNSVCSAVATIWGCQCSLQELSGYMTLVTEPHRRTRKILWHTYERNLWKLCHIQKQSYGGPPFHTKS